MDDNVRAALQLLSDVGQLSISMIQRRLKIGYACAGRLVDYLTYTGLIDRTSITTHSLIDASLLRQILTGKAKMPEPLDEHRYAFRLNSGIQESSAPHLPPPDRPRSKDHRLELAFDLAFCLQGGEPATEDAEVALKGLDTDADIANHILEAAGYSKDPMALYARCIAFYILGGEHKGAAMQEGMKLLTQYPNFEAHQRRITDVSFDDDDPNWQCVYDGRYRILLIMEALCVEKGMLQQALIWARQASSLYPTVLDIWERMATYAMQLDGQEYALSIIQDAKDSKWYYQNSIGNWQSQFKQGIDKLYENLLPSCGMAESILEAANEPLEDGISEEDFDWGDDEDV